jgi:hypothetical protein
VHVLVIIGNETGFTPRVVPVLVTREQRHLAPAHVRLLDHVRQSVVSAVAVRHHQVGTPARSSESAIARTIAQSVEDEMLTDPAKGGVLMGAASTRDAESPLARK